MTSAAKSSGTGCAALFDLDGVLTDTAELHFQSWVEIARELGIAFDRHANHALRGLGRRESLEILLGARSDAFSEEQKQDIARRKNELYLKLAAGITAGDLLPGAKELLKTLRAAGWHTAVASSSRNAALVIDKLGIAAFLDAIIDGNTAPRSKPDPQVFQVAAQAVGTPPGRCVVIEDAASGVAAAHAAGMRVVGVGAPEQLRGASLIVSSLAELSLTRLTALLS